MDDSRKDGYNFTTLASALMNASGGFHLPVALTGGGFFMPASMRLGCHSSCSRNYSLAQLSGADIKAHVVTTTP